MRYVKTNPSSLVSICRRVLSAISTVPTRTYPPPQELYPELLPALKPSPSGLHRISSIRAWWTSRATASKFQKT